MRKVIKTKEDFIERCKETRDDLLEYEFISSEYLGRTKNFTFLHKTCGNTFEMRPGNFLLKQKCPKCRKQRIPKCPQDFIDMINEFPDYILQNSSELVNSSSLAKFLHTTCGNIYETKFSNFVSTTKPTRCNHCSGNRKLSFVEVGKRIALIDSDYKVFKSSLNSERFKNVHSKIKIRHLVCDSVFFMSYNNFRNGQRCPLCCDIVNSKASKDIINYFNINAIKFVREYTFEKLLSENKRKLRYDFFLPEYNVLIEYDGKQHFEFQKNGIFTKDVFLEIQKRDRQKTKFAEAKGIPLLRVNYKEDHILMIKKFLSKYE